MQVRRIRIDAEQAGQRVDNFLLRELKGVPKSRIYRLLRKGEVRVNGGRSSPEYKLVAGDEVRVPPVRVGEESEAMPPSQGLLAQLEAAIFYEDAGLLALNKPPGIAVHGGSGVRHGVIEGLRALRPTAPFLELVHRLDRDTSGLLLIAKRRSRLRQLHEQLRSGEVEKHYIALLAGRLPRGPVPVEAPLDRFQLQGGERMVQVAADGKHARTVFRATERFPGATLVDARIDTGRTHQIRVHALHLGHPVIGDDKYGDREVNKAFRELGVRRLFLHAHSLVLPQQDAEPLTLTAPLFKDLDDVLARLRAQEKEHGKQYQQF
ncbi:MAG TPA: 23S rRNA pseudouridine(955/2504/2580) synthase RluC [Gammaproteobacteria bacterium]|nr:23S rRNA pseudouridine(955/2504/2580) synthase RluC [Gammaproteobacteria bacterium]